MATIYSTGVMAMTLSGVEVATILLTEVMMMISSMVAQGMTG